MTKTAVIYKSKHGHTLEFARYISDRTQSDLIDAKGVDKQDLDYCSCIVFGSSVYAGRILGAQTLSKLLTKYPEKKFVFFTVGMSDVNDEKYWNGIMDANFKETPSFKNVKVFHFAGGIDIKSLGFFSRKIINMVLKSIKSKPDKTANDLHMLEATEKKLDNNLSDADAIIDYLNTL